MKKLIILLPLMYMFFFGQAQIIKEHDYSGSATLASLAVSGEKYYAMDWSNNRCLIYNTDHSLWKSIDLPVPPGQYLYDISHVSETLFNLDDKVELAYVYYAYDTALYYFTYTTKVMSEDGSELLVIPGASYSEVKNVAGSGAKLLAWVYNYSILPYTVNTMVYAVPGQPASGVPDQPGAMETAGPAFPNPARSFVTIPYLLPGGTDTGEISVTDCHGRVIRVYTAGRAFPNLQINTAGWPHGIYYYTLTAEGNVSTSGKFIVAK